VPVPQGHDVDGTLAAAWADYRTAYIQADGRVIDRGAEDRTTSEGQAYALVRALWSDDRPTFDLVRTWTRDNLQAGDPARLPAWGWGRRSTGDWGVLDPMPAADADQWIAWALLGAADRWHDRRYRVQARALLGHVWDQETVVIRGETLVLPGPWAKEGAVVQGAAVAVAAPTGRRRDRTATIPGATVRLNPSYWLPFAWRTFATADPAHPWASLVDPAYRLLDACRGGAGLPSDWCWVEVDDGRVVAPPPGSEAKGDFGFEAFRIGWTLAAEVYWYGEPRAQALLEGFGALGARWQRDHHIPATLAPDGSARVEWEYPAMYGALLPAWALTVPEAAGAAWKDVLVPSRTAHGWGPLTDYYGQNWIWMGYALWTGAAFPVDTR
jgi:endoglucanase